MDISSIANIWKVITYNCNNRCSWCYAASNNPENHKKQMRFGDFKGYVDLFTELNLRNLVFIGGEPTLHPNLLQMMSYARSKNVTPKMVTNGRRFRHLDFCEQVKSAGLTHATVSIEGIEAEHDAATGVRGSFSQTIQGIENLIECSVGVTTETTITRMNYDRIEDIVSVLSDTGVKRIGFNICTPCLTNMEGSTETVSPSEGARAIVRAYRKCNEKGVKMISITPLPKCAFEEEEFKELDETNSLNRSCYVFYGSNTVVDYNGDVLPCVHFTGFPIMSLKDEDRIISDKEFLARYNEQTGVPYRFRKSMWKYPSENCSRCDDWAKKCIAGCPVIWYKYDPEKELTQD